MAGQKGFDALHFPLVKRVTLPAGRPGFDELHSPLVKWEPYSPLVKVETRSTARWSNGRHVLRHRAGGVPGRFENNYFTEMCSASEAGSYLRLIDFVYHPTLGLRVIKKKKKKKKKSAGTTAWLGCRGPCESCGLSGGVRISSSCCLWVAQGSRVQC